jgi:hypothetical protein
LINEIGNRRGRLNACPFPFPINLETYERGDAMAKTARVPASHKRGNLRNRKTGTPFAIVITVQSEADFDDLSSSPSWGGARNRADRVSLRLPLSKAQAIIGAAYRAIGLGLPFNRFVTVHWTRAGIDDEQAAWATGRLVKLASDWAMHKGVRIAWAWVRENDSGDGSKGSHVHMLIHCPAALHIGRMWRRWIRRITGRPYVARVIKSARIGGTLNTYRSAPALYRHNLDAVLAYVCKGVHSADGVALGLPRTEPGGRIIGKRAAWSQCLAKI